MQLLIPGFHIPVILNHDPDLIRMKNKRKINYVIVSIYLFIAVFASIIANDKPILFSINGKYYFPALSSNPYIDLSNPDGTIKKMRINSIDWKNYHADKVLFAPVNWSPVNSDLENVYASPLIEQYYLKNDEKTKLPFRFRHFLGTGKSGNDVLAGLIHGTRTSVSIGLFSMIIASLIGILLGGIAGYFGDDRLKIRRGGLFISLLLIIPAWFYSFQLRLEIINHSFESSSYYGIFQILISTILFLVLISWPLLIRFNSLPYFSRRINFPVDSLISRFIEIFLSLPRLILILTIAAISKPSVSTIIIIIGITSWTEIARIMRAQVLQLRTMDFISAARVNGKGTLQIITKHFLPNAISQITVFFTFGIASAILVETGLSFLGIGVPAGTATWGSLMFEARENYQAWWLVVFSGAAIFFLLSSLFIIGNTINKSAFKISKPSKM